MVVVSVSLSAKNLLEFDQVTAEMNYSSRSDAVRDAIHKFLQEHRWYHMLEHRSHFLLSLLYKEGSKHQVTEVLHRHNRVIHSSSHTHFDGQCADQLVLLGPGNEIAALMRDLAGVKDVRVCNCIV
ncbi:MAG TPA: hypothetical protein VJN63_05380 [Thermoplasmata archaeon]|nr:hypothetical protein [Thermoplasmata archaeon]